MTGIVHISSGSYIFRDDHGHGAGIWAWNIHDDFDFAMVHKWKKFPRGSVVELFDIDNPPETVHFQPLLN